MMTGKTPLLAKVSCGLSIAFLALAFTSGVSAVRAQSDDLAPTWREVFVDPVLDAVKAAEDRLANLEAKVAWFARSFSSRQITTHELCVADDTGARTCISKAQLDRLLNMMQTAAIERPAPVTDCITEPKGVADPAEVAPVASAAEASALDEATEDTTTAGVSAARPAAMAAQGAPEDAFDRDTRSAPASSATPGQVLLAYPEEEIIPWD